MGVDSWEEARALGVARAARALEEVDSKALMAEKRLRAHIAQATMQGQKATLATVGRSANRPLPSWDEMLRVRMRWPTLKVGDFISVDVRKAGEKVFVWIITKDFKSVVIEDTADMFPSDQMVTQIRLLQG